MNKIFLFLIFACIPLISLAQETTDVVEQSIQAMIQNVQEYTLSALWEQQQLLWIENLKALQERTIDLKTKIQAMEPTQKNQKYLSMLNEVLISIEENTQKLELSLDRDIEKLKQDLETFEIIVSRVNHKEPELHTTLSIYEGSKFGCDGIESVMKEETYDFFAWNSCIFQNNQLTFYLLSGTNTNSWAYQYELFHLNYDEWLKQKKHIESGTGITQKNILEKNIIFRNIPEYFSYIQSFQQPETPQMPSETTPTQESSTSSPNEGKEIIPSSQPLEWSITQTYSGEKVWCESAQTLANQRYSWAAWNRCDVKNNILTLYVLGLVDETAQSYIYEKHTINFTTKTKLIEYLESGVGVHKWNLIEKNRGLRTKY